MSQTPKGVSAVGTAAVLLIIGLSVYHSCFRVTNEIGPIGADKAGRQIFLQSLQHYMGEPLGFTVTSEWSDLPLLKRLLVQEPMRTTIRFVFSKGADQPDPRPFAELLEAPYPRFFALFNSSPDAEIWLREEHSVPLADFSERLDELGAFTVEDMFASLGFRRFEVYHGGRALLMRDLPEVHRANVKWVGGGDE